MDKSMKKKVFALALAAVLIALVPAMALAEGRGWGAPTPVQVNVTEPGGRAVAFPIMVRTDDPEALPLVGDVELVYAEPSTELIATAYLDAMSALGRTCGTSVTWTEIPGTLTREGLYKMSYTADDAALNCSVYIPGYDVPLSDGSEEGYTVDQPEEPATPTVVTIIETASEHIDKEQGEQTQGEEINGEETTEDAANPIVPPTPTDGTEEEPQPAPEPENEAETAPEETPVPGQHKVQFYDMDGQLWMEMIVEEGASIAKPDVSGMHDAYAFAYWYQGTSPEAAFDFSQPVTGNLKLHAAMELIPLPSPEQVLLLDDEEGDEDDEEDMPYVWIEYQFNDDETVTLFANADNLPNATSIEYQWQNDASGSFQDVPGAHGPTFKFRMSDKEMFCNWRMRLTVSVK